MKLTKKILEQLIKEEIELTGKAQAEEYLKLLPKKDKASMLKKVFKVFKPILRYANKVTGVPPAAIAATIPGGTHFFVQQTMRDIEKTYKKDGIDAALLKTAEIVAENIPLAGELMGLDELIKYIAPKASKSFEAAKQSSLTTKNPATRRAVGLMRLKAMQESKSKLEQLT